jgi:hypothetical protein
MVRIANVTTEPETNDEIEVTPEMIEAGVTALEAASGALSDRETVIEVYIAMKSVANY